MSEATATPRPGATRAGAPGGRARAGRWCGCWCSRSPCWSLLLAAPLRRGVLAAHRLRGVRRDRRRDRAEPAGRHHRPAVPGARLLPRRRRRSPTSSSPGSPAASASRTSSGLGLPPLVGMIVGVLLAGLAGLLFSPIAARLRGIYLGVASLGLVFIGQHVLNSWTSVTGGFNGRAAPEFSLFGFTLRQQGPAAVHRRRASSARPSGSGTSGWSSPWPPTCSPATCCAAGPAGRCRPCATARSPRR